MKNYNFKNILLNLIDEEFDIVCSIMDNSQAKVYASDSNKNIF